MINDAYLSPVLKELVPKFKSYPRWQHYLEYEVSDDGSGGWHFFIVSDTEDSLNPGQRIRVRHGFLVPAASYNRNTWAIWLLERVFDVCKHETCEFVKIDGVREFAPHHSNGENPYVVWHVSDYATAAKRSGDD